MAMRILILYTGGTVGMVRRAKDGALQAAGWELLRGYLPEVDRLPGELTFKALGTPKDSSEIGPHDWLMLARMIKKSYDQFDGFVVLHGTDTMAYTASALAFLLKGLRKPVILTGSQLPLDVVRTDARKNIVTALSIAADPTIELPEVAIYFDSLLLRGLRAMKQSVDRLEAFASPNAQPLAQVGVRLEYHTQHWLPMPPKDTPLEVPTHIGGKLGVLAVVPGMSEDLARHVLQSDLDALVLLTFGSGNAPSAPALMQALRQRVEQGLLAVNLTQCVDGAVAPHLYASSRELYAAGVLPGADMTLAATVAKLHWLLGQPLSQEDRKRLFLQNLLGERGEG